MFIFQEAQRATPIETGRKAQINVDAKAIHTMKDFKTEISKSYGKDAVWISSNVLQIKSVYPGQQEASTAPKDDLNAITIMWKKTFPNSKEVPIMGGTKTKQIVEAAPNGWQGTEVTTDFQIPNPPSLKKSKKSAGASGGEAGGEKGFFAPAQEDVPKELKDAFQKCVNECLKDLGKSDVIPQVKYDWDDGKVNIIFPDLDKTTEINLRADLNRFLPEYLEKAGYNKLHEEDSAWNILKSSIIATFYFEKAAAKAYPQR